jgi:hypothetical protein
VAESLSNRLRGLLASDVYTEKGRLRSDDLLVRERIGHDLSVAAGKVRDLISAYRTDRVPPSTRENPFPPAEVMEPLRKAERLCKAIDETGSAVRGLPLLNADRVWDRVRRIGLDELLQFDWTLVGEADALATSVSDAFSLEDIDTAAVEGRLRKIREVMRDRQKYIEVS